MAMHLSLDAMAVEAIEENLAVLAHCLFFVKQEGGRHGYPATLLSVLCHLFECCPTVTLSPAR